MAEDGLDFVRRVDLELLILIGREAEIEQGQWVGEGLHLIESILLWEFVETGLKLSFLKSQEKKLLQYCKVVVNQFVLLLELARSILLLYILSQEELKYLRELIDQNCEPIRQLVFVITGPYVLAVLTEDHKHFQNTVYHQQRLFRQEFIEIPQVVDFLEIVKERLADDALIVQALVEFYVDVLEGFEESVSEGFEDELFAETLIEYDGVVEHEF